MGIGVFAARFALAGDRVVARGSQDLVRFDVVYLGGVEAEDARAKLERDFGVAVFVLEFVRDLKGAEGLYLILRRAVPDAVGAAEDVLLADMFHQLADDVAALLGARML